MTVADDSRRRHTRTQELEWKGVMEMQMLAEQLAKERMAGELARAAAARRARRVVLLRRRRRRAEQTARRAHAALAALVAVNAE